MIVGVRDSVLVRREDCSMSAMNRESGESGGHCRRAGLYNAWFAGGLISHPRTLQKFIHRNSSVRSVAETISTWSMRHHHICPFWATRLVSDPFALRWLALKPSDYVWWRLLDLLGSGDEARLVHWKERTSSGALTQTP